MTIGVLDFDVRPSTSPSVERVWRARSTLGGPFTSIAAANVELVVERSEQRTTLTLRGPESAASTAVCPPETTWLGIRLRVGTYFGSMPSGSIRDGRDMTFDVQDDTVALRHGTTLPLPRFDDAEAFVQGLVAAGFLRRDALVESVVSNGRVLDQGASHRTVQRRFAWVTGLTRRAFVQIERARFATHLLQRGADIAGSHGRGTRSVTTSWGSSPAPTRSS